MLVKRYFNSAVIFGYFKDSLFEMLRNGFISAAHVITGTILLLLAAAESGNKTTNYRCTLSSADNSTFLSSAFRVQLRPPDDITFVVGRGWSPSTNASWGMLVVDNGTALPTFWVQLVSLASPVLGSDDFGGSVLSFMDDRFRACISFEGGTTAALEFCASGSLAAPGQFRFSELRLPVGSWTFKVSTLFFEPTSQRVTVSSSPVFCCANVATEVPGNASLLRFSPRINGRVLYHQATLCATVGHTFAPLGVEVVRLTNTMSSNFRTIDDVTSGASFSFRCRLVAGSGAVVRTWNLTQRGSHAEAVFRDLVVADYESSASLVFDVIDPPAGVSLNTMVLYLSLFNRVSNDCDLMIPHSRNQPFLTRVTNRWGTPISSSSALPSVWVVSRASDRTLSTAITAVSPATVCASVRNEDGVELFNVLEGQTVAVEAEGVSHFDGLRLKDASHFNFGAANATGLLWLEFAVHRGLNAQRIRSLPIIVLRETISLSSASSTITFDHRNDMWHFEGALERYVAHQTLPEIRIVLQKLDFVRRVAATSTTVRVDLRACVNPLPEQQFTAPALLASCNATAVGFRSVLLQGTTVRRIDSLGVVSFDDLVIDYNETAPIDAVLTFTVISCDDAVPGDVADTDAAFAWGAAVSYALTAAIRVRFGSIENSGTVHFVRNTRMPSLFTDEFQTATFLTGVPLPPIVVALRSLDGSLDTRNTSGLFLLATTNAGTLYNSVATHSNGFFIFPGIVVTHVVHSLLRLRFTLESSLVNISETLYGRQVLHSGSLVLLQANTVSRPYALSFSGSSMSFVGRDDVSVTISNGTSIPSFFVVISRADQLRGFVSQSVLDNPPASSLFASQVTCSLCYDKKCTEIHSKLSSIVSNGSAAFSFPSVITSNTLIWLQCCLNTPNVVRSCTLVVAVIVQPRNSSMFAVAASTAVAQRFNIGLSVGSFALDDSPIITAPRYSIEVTSSIACKAEESVSSIGLCSQLTDRNATVAFPFVMHERYGSRTSSTQFPASIVNGIVVANPLSIADGNSTPPDGLLFAVVSVDNIFANSQVHIATDFVAVETTLASLETVTIFIDAVTYATSMSAVVEALAELVNIDSERLWIRTIQPATLPLVSSSQRTGTRIELSVSPAYTFTLRQSDSGVRLQNQLLALSPSCVTTARFSRHAPMVLGAISASHTKLSTRTSTGASVAVFFCDIFLFEALAESSRHCELIKGPGHRCGCFASLFSQVGSACVNEPLLTTVCDHMAYCTASEITTVCSMVEPNIALQVLLIVGGTLLGLGVLISIVKYRAILKFISRAKFQMHENEVHVVSRQSGTRISAFQ